MSDNKTSLQKPLPVKHDCGGNLVSYSGAFSCTGCGAEWVTNREKHAFYLEHKAEILADIAKYGRPTAGKRWCIPQSTMTQLLSRWKPFPGNPAAIPLDLRAGNGLPLLPPWRDDWDPAVQERWLDTYIELIRRESQEEVKHDQADQGRR